VCRNIVRRWPLLGLVAVVVFIACAAVGRFTLAGRALASAAAAPAIVAMISAMLFATATLRRRRRLANRSHCDWLASLPSDLPLEARAASAPALTWACVAVAIIAAASGSAHRFRRWLPSGCPYCRNLFQLCKALVAVTQGYWSSADWAAGITLRHCPSSSPRVGHRSGTPSARILAARADEILGPTEGEGSQPRPFAACITARCDGHRRHRCGHRLADHPASR